VVFSPNPDKISNMATNNSITGTEGTPPEPAFLQTIIDSFPGIIYVNEISLPGDIHSFHNVYINQPGLDFMGCNQNEISNCDYNFFREMIHPDDFALLAWSLQTVFTPGAKQNIAVTLRIKSKDQDHYSLFHCIKIILDTFEDGRMKKVLVYATEITGVVHPGDQILHSLHQITMENRLMHQYHFTPREQQILHLIVKGATDSEIAEKLIISISTASKHRNNMILKSKVKNSAVLVALAVEYGGFSCLD
jgi:DNA-binding CsgD family transcriptional regulator